MGTIQIDGSTPKLTIGNATAEDATILFDGNAQDFYIALDDSADDLLIGLGSTVGTTPAIAIDENLKVNIPVTTASTSASTGSLTTGGGAGIGADLYVGDDAYLITDSAVLGFGADKDTLLTHTDGTGLTLNSTNKLCFNDASQFVQGSSNAILSLGATDEIDLTATAIDINGTADISGTTTLGGTLTVNAGAVFNEASADADFRIESNGNADRFFVNGGDNTVLFGTQTTQAPGGDSYAVQIFGTSLAEAGLTIMRGSADSGFPALVFSKSRNTTPGSNTIVADDDILGRIDFFADDGTNINTPAARILAAVDGTPGENDMPARLEFYTTLDGAADVTKRMVIDNGGAVTHAVATDGYYGITITHSDADNPAGIKIEYSGGSPDGADDLYLHCLDKPSGAVSRMYITSDGDLLNHDNAYGQISDERIKQDIKDANSQWDDIKALKVRNFTRKDDVRQYGESAWEQIGLVAQEAELVSPKLITENTPTVGDIQSNSAFGTLYEEGDVIPEDKQVGDIKTTTGETVKAIKYSVLYMKAIKALQEAQTRIETLEAKVAVLEG